MTTLLNAHHEWSKRADDERFPSIEAMHTAALRYRTDAAVAEIKSNALRVAAEGETLLLEGPTGARAKFSNWSYGQVCERAKAPASFISTLTADTAARVLNEKLEDHRDDESNARILFDRNGGAALPTVRGVTSDKYARIWNSEITQRLVDLKHAGPWQEAPAAFDGSRGCYLSDRDMFAFMVDNDRRIFETGPGGGLSRGFFVGNSEVGARRFYITTFLYEYVCGNHRVWGAQEVGEVSIVHIGHGQEVKALEMMRVELKKYAETSSVEDEAKVAKAHTFEIAGNKADLIDAIFKLRIPVLSKKVIGAAYDLAEKQVDWYGAPTTAWGFAGGLTQIARDLPNGSDRLALDQAAGEVMEMAF